MARRRDIKLVDLCKINTDAFRRMTPAQLKKAEQKIGTYMDFNQKEGARASYVVPKKIERRNRIVNSLLHKFISSLHSAITNSGVDRPGAQEQYEASHYAKRLDPITGKPVPWASEAKIKQMYYGMAKEYEARIWQWQERAKCSIAPNEMVARDAEREKRDGWEHAATRLRKRPLIR